MSERVNDKRYGVLVHGAGWVSTQHIAAFSANPHSRVVAISSRKLSSAKRRAEEAGLLGVACYGDLSKALAHDGVDIVVVCTPQHVHYENVLAALAARKHVVIEKPAGMSLDELRRMREAARAAGVKTLVSFVLRWNPLFATLKRMIADDAVGDICCVEADYLSYSGDWWRGFEDGRRKDTGGSAMLVGGCHAIDAVRWFAERGEFAAARPVEVFGYSGGKRGRSTWQYDPIHNTWHEGAPLEYDGLEVLLVRFANGVIGKVGVNFEYIGPYTFPLNVYGQKGTVRGNRIWSHKYPGQTDWVELPTICPDSANVTHHPFQAQADHFLECVRGNVESHCNLEDAFLTHEVAFAAQECYRTGRPVTLPLP